MRVLPIVAAAAIGLFASAAVAQNMNTTDPNSAPGASSTGGKVKRSTAREINKMSTTDPNSAPRASAKGGKMRKPMTTGQSQNMDTSRAGNPNQAGGAAMQGANAGSGNPDKAMSKKMAKKHKAKKKHM